MKHITTYSGEDFEPLSAYPNPKQIHITDIAHSLSLMCRANGHFTTFFSVAQHCINCAVEAKARGLPERVQLACLLHDASEAYISDVTRPVKRCFPEYIEAESRLQNAIYCKFLRTPLSESELEQLEQIDNDMLVCEFNALMPKKVFDVIPTVSIRETFEFRDFTQVENEFLEMFKNLFSCN